jgi:hypothetical protein
MIMSLQQLRKEVNEIKENVKSHVPRNMLADIPLTDEIVRCCNEFIRAQYEAKQRLIDSGVSEAELKKHEYENFIDDPLVMKAHHNKLIAITNTRIHNTEPEKINYLYGPEPWDDLV